MAMWWQRLKRQLIVKLGGYTEAESAIDAVTDPKEKRRLLTLAVMKCFNTIGPDDILHARQADRKWMLEGKPMSDDQKSRLIAEAGAFERSFLWKALQADAKYQANRSTYLKAEGGDDLIAGKMFHYTLDTFKTRIKSLARGSSVFNIEARK